MIEVLMSLIYALFQLVLPASATGIPGQTGVFIGMALDYMAEGMVLLSQFVDLGYLLSLFVIILEVDLTIFAFRVFMWLLRKIPFFGIS